MRPVRGRELPGAGPAAEGEGRGDPVRAVRDVHAGGELRDDGVHGDTKPGVHDVPGELRRGQPDPVPLQCNEQHGVRAVRDAVPGEQVPVRGHVRGQHEQRRGAGAVPGVPDSGGLRARADVPDQGVRRYRIDEERVQRVHAQEVRRRVLQRRLWWAERYTVPGPSGVPARVLPERGERAQRRGVRAVQRELCDAEPDDGGRLLALRGHGVRRGGVRAWEVVPRGAPVLRLRGESQPAVVRVVRGKTSFPDWCLFLC